MEHRRTLRFEVHVPVVFDWSDESGNSRRGAGFTHDLSRSGMFAWCEGECPPPYANLSITLLFPGLSPQAKPWRMRCTGRILRIHEAREGKGFAAILDNMETEDWNNEWLRRYYQ